MTGLVIIFVWIPAICPKKEDKITLNTQNSPNLLQTFRSLLISEFLQQPIMAIRQDAVNSKVYREWVLKTLALIGENEYRGDLKG